MLAWQCHYKEYLANNNNNNNNIVYGTVNQRIWNSRFCHYYNYFIIIFTKIRVTLSVSQLTVCYRQWRRLHRTRGERGTCPQHFYKWLGTWDTVSRRTANTKPTKLYWTSRKRSPKRLIELLEPKSGGHDQKKCSGTFAPDRCPPPSPTLKFVSAPPVIGTLHKKSIMWRWHILNACNINLPQKPLAWHETWGHMGPVPIAPTTATDGVRLKRNFLYRI